MRGAADATAALRVIAEAVQAAGVAVEVVAEELPTLPAAYRAPLMRVGREALRNAAKHAPGSHVQLSSAPRATTRWC